MTSGTIFFLLVLAHVLRVFAEGPGVMRDPFFAIATLLAAALGIWAIRVLRLPARP
jgi:hypothetical protein